MSATMAYLRRDLLMWTSYRLSGFWQVLSIFMVIGMIYFAGTAIGTAAITAAVASTRTTRRGVLPGISEASLALGLMLPA